MKEFLTQAQHNQEFHDCIAEEFADKFHDWRITVLFYVAIHYLKALASKRGVQIGDTHHEIECNVNPDRPSATMKIKKNAWKEYKRLYDYSRTARYAGYCPITTFEELKKIDYQYCLQHLEHFKKYVKGEGVPVDDLELLDPNKTV
jgi:hypothetical protein